MKLSDLQRDVALVESGEWVGDIPTLPGLRFKVRGMSSKLYQATFSRLARQAPRSDHERGGSLKLEASARVLGEALHKAVLIDWDGLTEEDGTPIPYDAERAREILTDPAYEPFRDAVVWCAGVVDSGRAEDRENLEKNSSAPSAKGSKPEPTAKTA